MGGEESVPTKNSGSKTHKNFKVHKYSFKQDPNFMKEQRKLEEKEEIGPRPIQDSHTDYYKMGGSKRTSIKRQNSLKEDSEPETCKDFEKYSKLRLISQIKEMKT